MRRIVATPSANKPGQKDANGAYMPQAPSGPKPFKLEDFLFAKQLHFVLDPHSFKIAVCSRRAGKCRPAGTLVKTPTGSTPIEQLKVGDDVYGYNNNGTVSITKVTALHDQGVKDVVDMRYSSTTIASSTVDHKWLAHNTHKNTRKVKPLKDFNCRDKIATEYVPISGGTKEMAFAYTLGALLGDGCGREPGLVMSGKDSPILNAVSKELGFSWTHSGHANYSNRFNGVDKSTIPYYNQWLGKRYAHEKTCELAVIRTWTRASQLRFLAGLLDTDGSVELRDGRLVIRLGMQAKDVVDTAAMLFLDLFQIQVTRAIDKRTKYKNGPIYILKIGRNVDAKRALKELPTQCSRKQWKSEYENLVERNTNRSYVGFKVSAPYKAHCWDITIGNDSHLFLDANGMIGHNTVACAADLIHTALNHPGTICLYITLARNNAKKLIWPEIIRINREYDLKGAPDNTELSLTFPNGSIIYLSGAKDASEIEKFRGLPLKKVYVDECQSFRAYIRELIDDVISPALLDYAGTLCLIGTPGAIPIGFFAETAGVVKGKETAADAWTHHHWTFFDNPHLPLKSGKTHQELLDRELKRRGVTVDDPSIQREFFGRWVLDTDSLLLHYNQTLNHFSVLPALIAPHEYTYIMGIDLGFNDADAIAILAWSNVSPKTYLVEEKVTRKQDISALIEQVQLLKDKYKVVKMVIDEGGLGKKIAEEIRRRHHLPVQLADKARKMENIAFLNDALRTGRFMANYASQFAQECFMVEIDRDKSRPDKIKVSDKFHSDIMDAVLYAFKESPAYTYEEPRPEPERGTAEWNKKQQDAMFDSAMEHFSEQAEQESALSRFLSGEE